MTRPHRISIFGWIFAFGVMLTLLGICLGISSGFNNLSVSLTIVGACLWFVFGFSWYFVFTFSDSHQAE